MILKKKQTCFSDRELYYTTWNNLIIKINRFNARRLWIWCIFLLNILLSPDCGRTHNKRILINLDFFLNVLNIFIVYIFFSLADSGRSVATPKFSRYTCTWVYMCEWKYIYLEIHLFLKDPAPYLKKKEVKTN